ncbi:putative bifunctional diguanylate cyclase/phosphodiesterase [Pseudoalteromonas phenolica]|uniref:putative bifunctional diguanylate cyclase/phosphodiesterase n=1 Tax=Pseudoalteromonas phenolica TaxID=161398 RepID=UPI00385041F3
MLAPSYPWFRVILPAQEFIELNNTPHVLIKHNDQLFAIKAEQAFVESILSPYALISILLAVISFSSFIRSNRSQQRQKSALEEINKDVSKLLLKFGVNSKGLSYGSTVTQIRHAINLLNEQVEEIQQQTDHHVYQDKLTQLIDRHAYIEHLEKQLKLAEQNKLRCGLLFIDLDGFKQVNDSFGHSFGDEILIQVANRLKDIVRQFKIQDLHPQHGIEQNLSRLGGDEFSVFVPDIRDPAFCTELAQAILAEIERDFVLGNKLIKIGASIGIASYPESASQPHALLQMSDVAMYRAKTDGRGIFRVYSPEMGNKMRRYHYLLEELRLAISSNSFHMSFQPIVHVEDCAIDYFEALIRWQHPIEGLIPPSEFIPIAEESNLILELGDWILLESCRQMSAWHNAGMKKVKISVNVSGIQLKHRDIYNWVMDALSKTGLPATALMLEITESTLITASDEIIQQLESCRKAGISIAIDDFGTGFSSLSTLADLPIDVIKIDKLFITQANENPKYLKILNSISELGHQLGLKIVAEGVEHIEQFELVKNLGIRCVQGYLVSRPETSYNVGTKVLNGNVNHIATTGTSVWLPEVQKS